MALGRPLDTGAHANILCVISAQAGIAFGVCGSGWFDTLEPCRWNEATILANAKWIPAFAGTASEVFAN